MKFFKIIAILHNIYNNSTHLNRDY